MLLAPSDGDDLFLILNLFTDNSSSWYIYSPLVRVGYTRETVRVDRP